MALTAKTSLLHSFDDPTGVEPGQTYIGVTGALNVMLISLEIGAYAHIAGYESDKETLFTTTIGISFIF